MTRIKGNVLKYLLVAALTLFAIDILTTLYGFRVGFEEGNNISLRFIQLLGGEDIGVLAAQISKMLTVLILFATYSLAGRLNPERQLLYSLLYSLILLAAIASAFYASVNNLALLFRFL